MKEGWEGGGGRENAVNTFRACTLASFFISPEQALLEDEDSDEDYNDIESDEAADEGWYIYSSFNKACSSKRENCKLSAHGMTDYCLFSLLNSELLLWSSIEGK